MMLIWSLNMFSRIRIEDTWDVRSPIALLVEREGGGRKEEKMQENQMQHGEMDLLFTPPLTVSVILFLHNHSRWLQPGF